MVWLDLEHPRLIDSISFVFLEQNAVPIPFEILGKSHKKKSIFRLQLSGIDSEKAARSLVGKSISIPHDQAEQVIKKESQIEQLVGFEVVDQQLGQIGEIDHVANIETNPLLVIQKNFHQIMIPVAEGIIVEVDSSKKIVHVDCPEGLIDLND